MKRSRWAVVCSVVVLIVLAASPRAVPVAGLEPEEGQGQGQQGRGQAPAPPTPADVQPGSITSEDVPYPQPVSYLPLKL